MSADFLNCIQSQNSVFAEIHLVVSPLFVKTSIFVLFSSPDEISKIVPETMSVCFISRPSFEGEGYSGMADK